MVRPDIVKTSLGLNVLDFETQFGIKAPRPDKCLINQRGDVVFDTQSDLGHARQMIAMFSKGQPALPQGVINTHEDADAVWEINSSKIGDHPAAIASLCT